MNLRIYFQRLKSITFLFCIDYNNKYLITMFSTTTKVGNRKVPHPTLTNWYFICAL